MSAHMRVRNRALSALLLGLAVAAAAPVDAQQVTARVGGELTGPQGTVSIPVTVDMSASGGQLLGSYTARLTWTPGLLYYQGYSQVDSSAQGNFAVPFVNIDSNSYGILRFTAVSPNGAGGLVTIANLRFYAYPDTVGTPIGLSFSEMSAAGTFANLLPILTTQGGTFCSSRGRWGDLDRDGQSNSRDALFVLSKVVGLPVDTLIADTALADVDADGRATSRDALVILSYAVGIQIPGQRVLLYAARSSCGTGSARQVAVMPAAIDLVPNQQFRLVVQATDSTGRTVATPATSWRSSDLTIAGVDVNGMVTPRAPGTATITAEVGPGVRATATVTVIPRRPNWIVDIAATGRAVQNGSVAYPYEHPLGAFPWVGEGDTVRVTRGTYYFDNDGEVKAGIVLLGGTPTDTTTRPLFVDNQGGYYSGLWLRGGQRTEVRNVAFRDFDDGIDLDGVRTLVVEDAKFLFTGSNSGDGIYHCGAEMDTVRIDRSVFEGDPQYRYSTGVYVSGCPSPLSVHVMLFRDSRVQDMGDGLSMYGVDSLIVLRSQFIRNGNGVYMSQEYNELPALYVAHSRFERNRYPAIEVFDMRRVVIDTSVFRTDAARPLDLEGYGSSQRARGIYLHGDSIYMETNYQDWLEVYNTDSLVIEDVVMRAPDDTATYISSNINADVAIIRRTKLLNLGGYYYSAAFDFSGRRLVADSVTMTGCVVAGCNQSYGFNMNASGVGAASSILRSSFSQLYRPIYLTGAGSVHEVRNVAIDSANTGVGAFNVDSVAVTDNVMTRVQFRGVDLNNRTGARGPSLVARNSITCTGRSSGQTGIEFWLFGGIVDQDTVTGCHIGTDLYTVGAGTRVRRSTLRSNSYGVILYQYGDSLLIPIDSNGISGSDTVAVLVNFGRVSLFHNLIENDSDGVVIADNFGYLSRLHDNAFVNNTGLAVNAVSVSDSVDASGNWWGANAPPPVGAPNGVSGRVDTTGYLSALPANLPGLAPPVFRTAPRLAAVAAAQAPRLLALPQREASPRPQPVYARAEAPGRSPERVAQIERNRERRSAQQAATAEREARRLAEQQTRLAERAQQEQAPTPQR